METKMNSPQKTKAYERCTLIIGIAVSLAVTVIARFLNVINAELSESSVIHNVMDIVISVFEGVIFAAGAAIIIHFLRIGSKKYIRSSVFFVLFILAMDYIASYLIDHINRNIIGGLELFTALFLLLNFAARALTYILLVCFGPAIMRGASSPDSAHIPVFSFKHPASRMVTAAALFHMIPYMLFEIYSNITGIMEYGWGMTGADILSIVSAYFEILLTDGIVPYFAAYILMSLYSMDRKEKKAGT